MVLYSSLDPTGKKKPKTYAICFEQIRWKISHESCNPKYSMKSILFHLQWRNRMYVVSIHSINNSFIPKSHWLESLVGFFFICFAKWTMQHRFYLSILLPVDWWVTMWERKPLQQKHTFLILLTYKSSIIQTSQQRESL